MVLNKCAGTLWESSKLFVAKGTFPMQNQFAVICEKGTPHESKQNIKCSKYNLMHLQNQGKVFLSYSNSLVLFMFLKNFNTIDSFHLFRTDV